MESYHANEARLKMRDILTSVERGEPVEIKRYDTPTAVVVPVEWYEHQRAALAGLAEAAINGDDTPVSAKEVRGHVVTLAALLDGFRKYAFTPEATFRDYWDKLNRTVGDLAGLLPENAED